MAVNSYLKDSNSCVEVWGNDKFTTFRIFLNPELNWLRDMCLIKQIIGNKCYTTMTRNKKVGTIITIVVDGLNANELKNEII